MKTAQPLLIELGGEELPPKALDSLSQALFDGVIEGLEKQRLALDKTGARRYCSPRRLAVYLPQVSAEQPAQPSEALGPSVAVGLKDGVPTAALQGFAAKNQVPVEALERIETAQGERFVCRRIQPGRTLAELLPGVLAQALKALPIPRPMRWGDHDYQFVRPVHWLVILHGGQVIPCQLLGLNSGRLSQGHRFMHPEPVSISHAERWLEQLYAAKVIADPEARRNRTREQIERAAQSAGGRPRLSPVLLDEISHLCEWPVALACSFEREFLSVPAEALVTAMETHQKFVPVFDTQGRLSEHFVGVANIESLNPEAIRQGYERVIRPRFADAKFFWDEDLKTPLADYQEALKTVTYQRALGSLWDKSVRVAELSRLIAGRLGIDAGAATRAAVLSRCDLLSRMVGEFPELQGLMGRYYASRHGEPAEIAIALDSYYQPRYAGDTIAADRLGQVLSVADRLDTLAGIFAVGLKPSGNKDPFALRRAALGLARTLIEGELELDLAAAFTEALELIPETALAAGLKTAKNGAPPVIDGGRRRAELLSELIAFVYERLRAYYAERGHHGALLEAVTAVQGVNLADLHQRLEALTAFQRLPQAESLAAANKRVGNILRKQEQARADLLAHPIDPRHFEAPAEHALAETLQAIESANAEPLAKGDYATVLARLAQLQAPVDAFFEAVLVNADDPTVRRNRLGLLARLQAQLSAVADIGRL